MKIAHRWYVSKYKPVYYTSINWHYNTIIMIIFNKYTTYTFRFLTAVTIKVINSTKKIWLLVITHYARPKVKSLMVYI